MPTLLKRIIKSGWQDFFRDGGLAAATVFILFLAVFLVSSLFLFREISHFLISSLEDKVDISVYFKDGTLEEDILNVKEELLKISQIKSIKYVSKEQALIDFMEKHKNEPVLMESLEEVGGNPFLPALNVKAWQASQYEAVSNFLESSGFKNSIEKVDYLQRKPVIERIFSLSSMVEKAGIVLSIILALIAVLVTFNTTRLAIYKEKDEIIIQRLVGASNFFIRGPFLVQGVICGLFAAVLCLIIFTLFCWLFSSRISFFFPDLNIFQLLLENFWILILIQLIFGIGLAVLSSFIAIRKYLKV